jgi:hypothetical protein
MRITLSRIVLFVCAVLLAGAPALRAQSVADLAPGARVRVVDPATGRVVGTVESVAGDSLVVLSGRGEHARTVTFSLASIRTLQVSRGKPSRPVSAVHGAALGLLTGAASGVAGATIGYLSYSDDCDGGTDDWVCFSMAESALIGVIIGAPMGAAWGAVAGFVFPQERWRSITVANPPVLTVNGSPDGVQLGLSITFP